MILDRSALLFGVLRSMVSTIVVHKSSKRHLTHLYGDGSISLQPAVGAPPALRSPSQRLSCSKALSFTLSSCPHTAASARSTSPERRRLVRSWSWFFTLRISLLGLLLPALLALRVRSCERLGSCAKQ